MFVTTPGLEEWVPPGLEEFDECTYWRAVMLTTQNPWFLLVYRTGTSGALRTVAVCWESRLMEAIHSVGPEQVVGLCRVSAGENGTDWRSDQVDEVWTPSAQEVGDVGPLLLRMRGEAILRDSFMAVAKPRRSGRTLLVSMSR